MDTLQTDFTLLWGREKWKLDFDTYLNGVEIGNGQADEVDTVFQWETFSFQSTLNLKKGDEIWLEIFEMSPGTRSVFVW